MQLLANNWTAQRATGINKIGFGILISGEMPESLDGLSLQDVLSRSLGGSSYDSVAFGGTQIGRLSVLNRPAIPTTSLITWLNGPNIQYRNAQPPLPFQDFVVPAVRYPTLDLMASWTVPQMSEDYHAQSAQMFTNALIAHYAQDLFRNPLNTIDYRESMPYFAANIPEVADLFPLAEGFTDRYVLCEYTFDQDFTIDTIVHRPQYRSGTPGTSIFSAGMAACEARFEALVGSQWVTYSYNGVKGMTGVSGVSMVPSPDEAARTYRKFRVTFKRGVVAANTTLDEFLFYGRISTQKQVPEHMHMITSASAPWTTALITNGPLQALPLFFQGGRGLSQRWALAKTTYLSRMDLPLIAALPVTSSISGTGAYIQKPADISMLSRNMPSIELGRTFASEYEVY